MYVVEAVCAAGTVAQTVGCVALKFETGAASGASSGGTIVFCAVPALQLAQAGTVSAVGVGGAYGSYCSAPRRWRYNTRAADTLVSSPAIGVHHTFR